MLFAPLAAPTCYSYQKSDGESYLVKGYVHGELDGTLTTTNGTYNRSCMTDIP